MAPHRRYDFRSRAGRAGNMVPDGPGFISDLTSIRSAPGSLQYASFERTAPPSIPGSLPRGSSDRAASPRNPSRSQAAQEEVLSPRALDIEPERTPSIARASLVLNSPSPIKQEPGSGGVWYPVGRNGKHSHGASRASPNPIPRRRIRGASVSEEVLASVYMAEQNMTPKERAEYHERMRREYERQELARLQHLRQVEEDAWVAEQLARTPDASQFTASGTAEGTETTEGQTPSESEDSGYYPTAELRRTGKVYEGLNNGKRWDYRNLEEKAARAGEAPAPREQVRYGSDERDERMAALERHLDQMGKAMERFAASQVARVSQVEQALNDNLLKPSATETEHAKDSVSASAAKPRKKRKKTKTKEKRGSMYPADQLEPSSYLGQVLNQHVPGGGPPDDSSSSSSSSEPDSSGASGKGRFY
ncbi:uncharacterized protein C8Q71DRAFT_905511 [Rhodofomes roseus]|uniref:Uncharacterized protein n=1 Tax=Rhodofomes roseus TaxID=34475 RepID=A0ABQ8KP21_9APHY|nr:uncharacterized protein C8Q71DRAFT_905511 [Rhodofomes roseus]KAH9840182.1 hypothetical protein C8Q71DRAFT_905511 [Rhodofomes roseus]